MRVHFTKRTGFARATDGTAAVEFSLIALPFIVLLLGTVQLLYVMLTQQMLETAAEDLSRRVLTGSVQQGGLTRSQFATLACSLLPSVMDCKKLIVDVQVANSFSAAVTTKPDLSTIGNPTATTVLTFNPGLGGQIVVMRLLYALPVVTIPGFNLRSASSAYGFSFPMATAVFKNETYS